jgi:tetratricopeptide (TPR) repeat protein
LYAGSLFPALGFFNVYPFLFSYVADHFQYLASAGMIGSVAAGGGLLIETRFPRFRIGAVALGVVVIGALAVASNRQSALYRNNETLFRANIARNPSAWMAHQNLAITLARMPDQHEEALREYREVLRLRPDHPDAHFGLGVELARLPGRKAEAIAE